jgi:sigma-B regulation protein RsbU (phosphoserine phosphatase)
MKILIAEDEAGSRRLLEGALSRWGYQVTSARDGQEAWEVLQQPDAPSLVVLDWLMPRLDGVEVCKRVRQDSRLNGAYVILLTSRSTKEDVVRGLEAGADDYVIKPFDNSELRARIQVGARVINLQSALAERVRELENALIHVKQLHGLLPICCYCKKIRDDKNYWHQVEAYVANHADVRFSHGICPECSARLRLELDARNDTTS